MGRPKTGKITITVRLLPDTKARLDRARAASSEKTNSAYIEKLLVAKFKREGIE